MFWGDDDDMTLPDASDGDEGGEADARREAAKAREVFRPLFSAMAHVCATLSAPYVAAAARELVKMSNAELQKHKRTKLLSMEVFTPAPASATSERACEAAASAAAAVAESAGASASFASNRRGTIAAERNRAEWKRNTKSVVHDEFS